jgi:hypothetical protein
MDQEIKAKWLAALRSGEYKQGKYRLVTFPEPGWDHAEYDPYGVLTDLYRLETGDPLIRSLMVTEAYLPHAVRDWAKLSTGNPVVPWDEGADGKGSLAGINDSGNDFEYIAKKIEENL